MKSINVLSLFDGMSCGMLALERAGIPVENYFASEIDKWAIQVSEKNFPNIKRMGDVTKCSYQYLKGSKSSSGYYLLGEPKEGLQDTMWDKKIDILIGGSPCQGFSFAGKQLNFEDPRSKLFFEYVRILKETKPKYFMLENVRMKKKYQDTISEYLGVQPIMINSSIVSAQNRVRLYWVGILQEDGTYMTANIPQPEDKGILLKDILEDVVDENFYISVAQRGRYSNGSRSKKIPGPITQHIEERKDKKANCITSVQKDSMILQRPRGKNKGGEHIKKSPTLSSNSWEHNNVLHVPEATKKGYIEVKDGDCFDATHISSSTRRGRDMKEKSNCMTAGNFDFMQYKEGRIRKLTPIECERLQTVPDNYTEKLDYKKYVCNIRELISNSKIGNIESSVELIDVKELHQPIDYEDSVLCITEESLSIEKQNYLLSKVTKKKNVNIAIEKLGKNDDEQNECVINITKTISDTEIQCILKKLEKNFEAEGTKKELMVKMSTGRIWKISFEENGLDERLFTILILIKLIMTFQTYIFVNDKSNISLSIINLKKLRDNLLGVELSDLMIENITYCSNSQRYKMLGNGWTISVISHIFTHLFTQ